MSNNFAIKKIFVDNYKSLSKIELKLKRINIIGGDNGSGKSSLIEFLFMSLDRQNPISIIRPFSTKGSPFPYPNGLKYFFPDQKTEKKPNLKICFGNSDLESIVFSYEETNEKIDIKQNTNSSSQLKGLNTSVTHINQESGIKIVCKHRGSIVDETIFFQPSATDITHHYRQANTDLDAREKSLINVSIISPDVLIHPVYLAELLSRTIKENKLDILLSNLKKFDPDIIGIETLVEGAQPNIYITTQNEIKNPIALMGSGFRLLLAITLHLSFLDGGLLLFDEIEGSIHHSKQKLFWSILSEIATKNNVQVIGITHSKEFLHNIYLALEESHREKDFKYFRFDKIKKTGRVECTEYTEQKIETALSDGWEIR